jgi:hypothetical protein
VVRANPPIVGNEKAIPNITLALAFLFLFAHNGFRD